MYYFNSLRTSVSRLHAGHDQTTRNSVPQSWKVKPVKASMSTAFSNAERNNL